MKSNAYRIFLYGFFIILIFILIINCSKQTSPIDPVGIYLETLGNGYVVIDRNPQGKLYIKDANIVFTSKWEVSFIRKKLKIIAKSSFGGSMSGQFSSQFGFGWTQIYELIPSQRIPGDWDLVNFKYEFDTKGQTVATGFNPMSTLKQIYQSLNPPSPLATLKQTVPSYLHRVNDNRVIEYFKSLDTFLEKGVPDSTNSHLLKIATELTDLYPNDRYVKALYLDALARNRDLGKLKKEKDYWEEEFSRNGDVFSQYTSLCAKESIRSIELSNTGRNAYDFIKNFFDKNFDLKKRMELFSKVSGCDEYIAPKTFLAHTFNPIFLNIQVSSKVFCVEAIFLILQGQYEEALNLISSVYQYGNFLSESNTLISQLIGVAIRSIATNRLEIYALNCCETSDDFKNFWNTLERLNKKLKEPEIQTSSFPDGLFGYYTDSKYKPNFLDPNTRHYTSEAQFQLVRMATAAKYRFVTQGTFPQNSKEFAPLLANGLPKDSFSSEPLKFTSNPDLFICYSIGPDKQDNYANIIYDVTNGTVSSGDIILKVPSQREYPFPKNGVRASTRKELLKQFPNKLPYDPFANRRNVPLKITNTTPVYVFSVGPDTDEREILSIGDSYVPKVYYDPTNGTTSAGDLFIAIPE